MLLRHLLLVGAAPVVSGAGPEPQEGRTPPPPDTIIYDCMSGPWIVFFGEDEARLDAWSQEILDRMLETRRLCGPFDLDVAGHRDRVEPASVSKRRVEAVRSRLLTRGLRKAEVHIRNYGDAMPRVASDFGRPEPQNRRVELRPRVRTARLRTPAGRVKTVPHLGRTGQRRPRMRPLPRASRRSPSLIP